MDDRVSNGICSIIKEKLGAIGYRGIWVARPVKLVGNNSDPFEYKSCVADYGTRETIHALCRPGDKGTCWEVSILPPSDYDVRDVAAAMGGAPRQAPPRLPMPSVSKVGAKLTVQDALKKAMDDKRVFVVKVTARMPHGLQVVTDDEFVIRGLIPIEHIDEPYNKANLHKYSQGDTAKACIVEVSDRLNKFSIVAAKAATGSNKMSEVFVDKPNSDGRLPLAGFSRDLDRRMMVIEWLKPLAIKYHPNPIPRDVAINTVISSLIAKYPGTKTVERKSAAAIIGSLVTGSRWLDLSDDESRDFVFTDLGWRTVGDRPVVVIETVDRPPPSAAPPAPATSISPAFRTYMTAVAEMLGLERQIAQFQERKNQIVKWLGDNHTKEIEDQWSVFTERADNEE